MVLISKKVLDEIGWFDKDYFLYYDDHDLMFRSKKKGNIHRFTPEAIGYHDTKTGSKNKYANKQWLYYSTREVHYYFSGRIFPFFHWVGLRTFLLIT